VSDAMLIGLPLAIAAAGIVLILASGRVPALRDGMTVAVAIAMFTAVLQALPRVAAGERPRVTWFEFFPGLSVSFEIEPLGMVFAMLASGLWILTAIYAIGYMRGAKEKHHTRFHMFFAVAVMSATGIAFAGNMFTLFLFYEVLTLSTYPLVAHKGTAAARNGARLYLGLLLGTSVGLLLPAIAATWWLAGSLDFTPGGIMEGRVDPTHASILLLLFMFGIGKAALMPFHGWLPAAMVAPTPVSALLHAVAVVKAGVFTVLKVTIYLFGLDYLKEVASSDWVLYAAVFTLLTASIVAMRQDNLKARLAYSTISQLSYIVTGALLINQIAALGAGMHIVMHAFGKITLFFCAGAIYVATKKTEISDMNGLGRRMPITFAAFFIGALCVIGIPPTGGVWSKWHLIMGAFEGGYGIVVLALMVSTLLNIGYLIPPVLRAFLLPPKEGEYVQGIREAPLLCVLPLALTALGCIAMFILAQPLAELLEGMFSSAPIGQAQ